MHQVGWAFVLSTADFLSHPQFLYIVWAYCGWISHDFRLELKTMCCVFYSNSRFNLQPPNNTSAVVFPFLKENEMKWFIERMPQVSQHVPEAMAQCVCVTSVPFSLQGIPLSLHHSMEVYPVFLRLCGRVSQMTVHWPHLGFSLASIHLQASVLFISTLCKIQKSPLDCKDRVHRKGLVWP